MPQLSTEFAEEPQKRFNIKRPLPGETAIPIGISALCQPIHLSNG
jgi:hypothetical protein